MSILKTIYLQHLNGANANMTLTSNERVGIGTSSPSAKLHVSTGTTGGIALLQGSVRTMYFEDDGSGSRISTEGTGQFSVRAASSGGNHLTIDGSGRVTMPYQPLASVRYDGVSKTSGWAIVYDNVFSNNGSCYNNTNGRFTCPVAGYYRVTACDMSTYATDSPCFLMVYKNGAGVSGYGYGRSAAQSHNHASIDAIVLCAVGDYLQVYSAANQYGGAYNHATFQLVG